MTANKAKDRRTSSSTGRTFIASDIERVPYKTLIPADYNPLKMDARTLKVLMGSLIRFGWVMPVVINRRTGNIVGGHQRATANAEVIRKLRQQKDARAKDYERPPAIFVDVSLSTEKAMNVALNQISGDWDFFKKVAADQLRQNATFAQMRRKHLKLGRGFKYPLDLADFNFASREHREMFKAVFGRRIIDFGAGGRQEVDWISKRIGVEVVPVEPFPREHGKVSLALSRKLIDAFLSKIAGRWQPDTVFCNFVLSSIGAVGDREQVLTILAALAHRAQQVVLAVRSVDEARYREVLGQVRNKNSPFLGIPDVTEPGLIVTGAGTPKQKFQKFYAADEFRRVLRPFFGDIRQATMEVRDSAIVMVCRKPRPVKRVVLNAALRFEFELKIDGTPLGRSERAIRTFQAYLSAKPRGRKQKRVSA